MAKRFVTIAGRLPLYVAVGIAWLWCVLALSFYPLAPRWLGAVFAVGFGAGTTCLLWRVKDRGLALRYFCVAALVVLLAWMVIQPTHDRTWSRMQTVMPRAEFNGDRITIRNIRNTVYGEDGDYEVQHYDQTFELSELESVWFGVHHFLFWKGVAHTFISFGFKDGNYLAISVESRRREGEGFSSLAGLFKQYGLIYIIGDERDVIGRRSLYGKDPIYLYPIKANRKQMRAMLLLMLRRADRLAKEPEFYNTLTNNCASNIVESFNQIAPIRISTYNPRIIFPGYSGDVAYDQGLIDTDEPFEEFQARAHINEVARAAAEAEDFSQRIRVKFQHE